MEPFRRSGQAKADLFDIWRYTAGRWGEQQADHYLEKIDARCRKLARDTLSSKTTLPEYPMLQVVRCEHHYIFYIMEDVPLIIAVLHEKMDHVARLKRRFGEGK